MRQLSVIEAAVLGSLVVSGLCVFVPNFIRNVHASRLVEPIDGLNRIAARAQSLALGRPVSAAYPASVPLTPAAVPRGELVTDPPGTWDHPTWRELTFAFTESHAYSFAFEAENGADASKFRAFSHGDLDGDGSLSTFSISGDVRRGATPMTTHLDIHREVE